LVPPVSRTQLLGSHRVWIALGIILALPALAAPFFVDDYIHLAFLEDIFPVHRQWWNLYTFVPDDSSQRETMLRYGMTPWWSSPELKLVLVRPLASAVLTLDHFLFGRHAFGWHLHSLLWWAVLLVSVSRLYRRRVPASVATLALAMFAMSASPHPKTLTRVSPNALLLEYTKEPGLDSEGDTLFRDPKAAMQAGTTVKMEGGLTVTVQAVENGKPKRVLFELSRPLEQTDFRLLAWLKRRLDVLTLQVGESTRFAAE
jgi:hypothetical protein